MPWGKAAMVPARDAERRRRGLFGLERGLGIGIGLGIVVGVLFLGWQAFGIFRQQSTLGTVNALITEVRQAMRIDGRGISDPVGMASYLVAANSVPNDATYTGSDPGCAAETAWGDCIELTSEVTGAAEYVTITFRDMPGRFCRRLMTVGPDGGSVLGGTAVLVMTVAPGEEEPRVAEPPNPADAARRQCAGADSATVRLEWSR